MTIGVKYDRSRLEIDDEVSVEAIVSNNLPGAAKMVVVDLGIPPGFDVMTEDFQVLFDNE